MRKSRFHSLLPRVFGMRGGANIKGGDSEKVSDKTPIPPPDWEALISVVADDILAERSPARILQVRERLYDLLTHCIPPTTVLKVLSPFIPNSMDIQANMSRR